MRFVSKIPGDDLIVGNYNMNMHYAAAFNRPLATAYERLLLDCMRGDTTLFARRDEVEEAWKFVTPILEAWDKDLESPIPIYDRGTDGPSEARQILTRDGHRWKELE